MCTRIHLSNLIAKTSIEAKGTKDISIYISAHENTSIVVSIVDIVQLCFDYINYALRIWTERAK